MEQLSGDEEFAKKIPEKFIEFKRFIVFFLHGFIFQHLYIDNDDLIVMVLYIIFLAHAKMKPLFLAEVYYYYLLFSITLHHRLSVIRLSCHPQALNTKLPGV